jgi:hypothetical protein
MVDALAPPVFCRQHHAEGALAEISAINLELTRRDLT